MANPKKGSTVYEDGYTLKAYLLRITDAYIYDVGDSAFEAIGTWDDARAAECDIAITGHGARLYTFDFPDVAEDIEYMLIVTLQAGGTPAITDPVLGSAIVNQRMTLDLASRQNLIDIDLAGAEQHLEII